jgi:hypothetical protein
MNLDMLNDAMWVAGDVLLLLILVRATQGQLLSKYPVVYSYFASLLVAEVIRVYIHFSAPDKSLPIYWTTQFVCVAAGYFLVWEIYRQALHNFPGTGLIARHVVSAIFVLILANVFLSGGGWRIEEFGQSVIRLERDFQAVQVVLLLLLQILISYYGIPLGRNIRGLLLGQGLFVSTSVAILAVRGYMGLSFQQFWVYAQQVCSVGTLLIWTHAFWSYEPNPNPTVRIDLEEDYATLVRRTNLAFVKARSILLRTLTS